MGVTTSGGGAVTVKAVGLLDALIISLAVACNSRAARLKAVQAERHCKGPTTGGGRVFVSFLTRRPAETSFLARILLVLTAPSTAVGRLGRGGGRGITLTSGRDGAGRVSSISFPVVILCFISIAAAARVTA